MDMEWIRCKKPDLDSLIIDPWLDRLKAIRLKMFLNEASEEEKEIYLTETNGDNTPPTEYETRIVRFLNSIKSTLEVKKILSFDWVSNDWEKRYCIKRYNDLLDEFNDNVAKLSFYCSHFKRVEGKTNKHVQKSVNVMYILETLGLINTKGERIK